MNILYIITIVAVYILFMLMHKTDKKQNLILWIATSTILALCYNVLVCVILTFCGALCTLQNLSICNIISIIALLTIMLKKKKIQKYYVETLDIIFSVLTLILVIFIAYKQYGIPFGIKYEITDGSSHYFFAQQFYENSTLLYNEYTDDVLQLYNSSFRLPGAYVNEGILFKVFDGIILKTDLFIGFDLLILFLSGILSYYLLKKYSKGDKKLKVIAFIFSIIYMLGYQLNSMIYGYVYLSLALDIIITFLLLMSNYEEEELQDNIAMFILSLISFGIFFTYAYFVPIIYISIIVGIIIKTIQNKEKILSENNMTLIGYLILVPLILGATYFIIMPVVKGMKTEISTIGRDGGIYENYITNYILFIPILIMGIIRKVKNKENNILSNLFILSILFALILLIGNKLEIVSEYYFFKAYYIIWPLAIYNTYVELTNILSEENKKVKIIAYIYSSIYIIAIITGTLVLKTNIGINHIFHDNVRVIRDSYVMIKNEEIKISEMIGEKIENKETYILAPKYTGRMFWMSVLHHDQQIYIDYEGNHLRTIDNWISERDEKYYIAFYEDYKELPTEKDNLNENSNEYKIIYKDEYAFILERK